MARSSWLGTRGEAVPSCRSRLRRGTTTDGIAKVSSPWRSALVLLSREFVGCAHSRAVGYSGPDRPGTWLLQRADSAATTPVAVVGTRGQPDRAGLTNLDLLHEVTPSRDRGGRRTPSGRPARRSSSLSDRGGGGTARRRTTVGHPKPDPKGNLFGHSVRTGPPLAGPGRILLRGHWVRR